MRNLITAVPAALSILMAAGIAGTFFAFSVAVMPALNGVSPATAITSMQSVNLRIMNPVFLGFFVLAPVLLAVTGVLLFSQERSAALLFLAAAGVYVLGAFLPTMAANVPMNDTLDAFTLVADKDAAARAWADFTGRWTAWNNVRGAAAGVSVLLAALACYRWGKEG